MVQVSNPGSRLGFDWGGYPFLSELIFFLANPSVVAQPSVGGILMSARDSLLDLA